MHIDMPLGIHIADALDHAHQAAHQCGQPVTFDFNGETVTVRPEDVPAQLLEDWQERRDAAAREYQASPAYVQAQTERAEHVRGLQKRINAMLPTLEGCVQTGPLVTLDWLRRFVPLADHVDVLIPHARLARLLGTLAPAGYGVGRSDLREPGNELEAARWVIGGAVTALQKGQPPHPMLGYHAELILEGKPQPQAPPLGNPC